jgi:hypothetical protein
MATTAEWVAQARRAILDLLELEHAIAPLEIEAKLAEGAWPALPRRIDPHHLTTARRQLLLAREIEAVSATTRGGSAPPVFALVRRTGRRRAFEDAAARKRLLYTRYVNWASRYFGRAGERVAHASLTAAAPRAGYRLFEPIRGEVSAIFGQPVPVGPLDNGGVLQLADERGRPAGGVVVLVEVKNIHHWIYPESAELYELLEKVAKLQQANQDLDFVPVLVCRRGHPTAFRMAKDLGFFIADARAQFVLPVAEVDPRHVVELRTELGLHDLVRPEVPEGMTERLAPYEHRRLVKLLAEDLPSIALSAAERFRQAAPILEQFAPVLRAARSRATLMRQLRQATRHLRTGGGW